MFGFVSETWRHPYYKNLVPCTFSLNLSLPKANLTKPRKLLNPELSNEKTGVITQIKALNVYIY